MGTKYTEEFKRDALRIYEREGARATSEKLGVCIKTLYAWHRAQRLENGSIIAGARPWETIEQANRRMEREIAELREVNRILKKAMGFMVGR